MLLSYYNIATTHYRQSGISRMQTDLINVFFDYQSLISWFQILWKVSFFGEIFGGTWWQLGSRGFKVTHLVLSLLHWGSKSNSKKSLKIVLTRKWDPQWVYWTLFWSNNTTFKEKRNPMKSPGKPPCFTLVESNRHEKEWHRKPN